MQGVAEFLSTTYIFEGMRSLILDGVCREELMWRACGLNLIYMTFGISVFLVAIRSARNRGLLMQSGE